jgi:hypothetical protein
MSKLLITGLKWLLGLVIAIVLALAIVMAIIGRENTWAVLFGAPPVDSIDFATLPPRAKANSFLLCPENLCAESRPDRISPDYHVAVESLAAIVRKIVESTEGLRNDDRARPEETGTASSGSELQWDYIVTTRHLRFPDLVTVRVLDLGNGKSSLAIFSRAVYGRRDFGANQNRIAAWMEAIEVAVALENSGD